jgi:hypothetical protein
MMTPLWIDLLRYKLSRCTVDGANTAALMVILGPVLYSYNCTRAGPLVSLRDNEKQACCDPIASQEQSKPVPPHTEELPWLGLLLTRGAEHTTE